MIVRMQYLAHFLQEKLLANPSIKRWVVAYSGGMDSHVLLHALASISAKLSADIVAFHINHGLQQQAEQWDGHCQTICQQLNIPYQVFSATITQDIIRERGIEAAARDGRYKIFAQHLLDSDGLLMAHHQDDQTETFFLRLMRGSGLKGLAAMPETRALGKAQLFRPFLTIKRDDLQHYAQDHKLAWIEDPSNQDTKLDRNYLRQQVIPLLQQRWPQLGKHITTSTSILRQAHSELEQSLQQTLVQIVSGHQLNVQVLSWLSPIKQADIIRTWLSSLDLSLPSYSQLENLINQLKTLGSQSQLKVTWPGVEINYFRNQLYAHAPVQTVADDTVYTWNLIKSLPLNNGCYSATQVMGKGLAIQTPVTVCYRSQATTSRTRLKKIFQSHAIPVWERDKLPLLFYKDKLIAVSDRWVSSDYCANHDEKGWYFKWLSQ